VVEERNGAIVHGMVEDAFWENSDDELSAHDLGIPGPSDGW
jgi:hypothetical protein